jgi:GNAT superfamily N-acetyltransferase
MDLYKFTADQIIAIETYLMTSGNKVLGMYGFKINTNNELQLDSFFIDPEYIGQGFGKKMWLECINTGLKYNRESFIIEADPNAEEFYIKMDCYKIREIESSVQAGRLVPILGYNFK